MNESKIAFEPTTGCWLWTGNKFNTGYGCVSRDRTSMLAHRVSWTEANGPIPPDAQVCHRCDTPLCVNPEHLFLGTRQDNMDDMVRKNRSQFGSAKTCAKLTEETVPEFLAECARTSVPKAARKFGLCKSAGYKVVNGESWVRVTGIPKDGGP